MANYLHHFGRAMDALKEERRYRVFAGVDRRVGEFPHAAVNEDGGMNEITVWCSNDYLGMLGCGSSNKLCRAN